MSYYENNYQKLQSEPLFNCNIGFDMILKLQVPKGNLFTNIYLKIKDDGEN